MSTSAANADNDKEDNNATAILLYVCFMWIPLKDLSMSRN